MKTVSHVVPNLSALFSSVKQKRRCLKIFMLGLGDALSIGNNSADNIILGNIMCCDNVKSFAYKDSKPTALFAQ